MVVGRRDSVRIREEPTWLSDETEANENVSREKETLVPKQRVCEEMPGLDDGCSQSNLQAAVCERRLNR